MPYTTHGYCTPADMAEIRADYDLDELDGSMKCPDCETRFDGFDGESSNTCRTCGGEYCDRCIDAHEQNCEDQRADWLDRVRDDEGAYEPPPRTGEDEIEYADES